MPSTSIESKSANRYKEQAVLMKINDMRILPRALLLKKLIKKRKNLDNQVNRKEFNVVS